ncbi:hypothetical protein LINPERPRIM_LOCUS21002 [Linum perenne]
MLSNFMVDTYFEFINILFKHVGICDRYMFYTEWASMCASEHRTDNSLDALYYIHGKDWTKDISWENINY